MLSLKEKRNQCFKMAKSGNPSRKAKRQSCIWNRGL